MYHYVHLTGILARELDLFWNRYSSFGLCLLNAFTHAILNPTFHRQLEMFAQAKRLWLKFLNA